MEKIVFLDRETLSPRVQLRRPAFAHELIAHEQTSPEQLAERLRGASIVITNKVQLPGAELARLDGLKLVAVAATGTDCVDKAWCQAHGVPVTNIRGYALHTVPEHAFALMLSLRRNLVLYRQDTLDGAWQRSGQFCFFDHPIRDLGGSRLGIIGEGVLGQRVAELGKAFGMTTMFAAHKGKQGLGPLYTPWDEVLETSDIISIHSPLTPDTANMIAMPEFRQMKQKPLLINTARGGLVVEEDMERALEEGLISGAGIDVTMPEPPPADGPLMRIARRPNVIVTPHIAWASDGGQQALADQLIDNIDNFIAGRPSNLVEGSY